MALDPRCRLLFGPYKTPRFRIGQIVRCARNGPVRVSSLSSGRIAWPRGRVGTTHAIILYRDLVRALRREAATAIAYWWGVTAQTVTVWRNALGIGQYTAGTRRLKRENGRGEPGRIARAAAYPTFRDPERCAKIGAALRGKPRPPHVLAAMHAANKGRKVSAETRRRLSEAQRRRWRRYRLARRVAD